ASTPWHSNPHRSFRPVSELLQRFSPPDSFFEVPGGRVATWRFGKGPDLVAIHGWPLHAATWRTLLPGLADHFTVHLLDLPGSGKTEWPGPVDLEICAQVVRT